MSGVKGNKPHKKPHKGCIGWIYCGRLDKTFDIGDQAGIPNKKGYMCSCGRYTRLDPFNHEVEYYDDNVKGIDYDKRSKLTPEKFKALRKDEVRILYWTEPMGKPKTMTTEIRINREVTELAEQKDWYAWNVFNKNGRQILTGLKKGV